jgi:integrator complex subunit 7
MATPASRLSTFGDNVYGDQDKDANSLLLELDKGLRSGKVGEQCEAIVRFPQLFEKYPFPILINSSFLKVADVFRVGSNYLRLCVLRVTQQSEKHLEKITSIDEFLRRIYAVIHSNDPVARALTLRTLGSVVCIIAERKNVHHSIISCLDSHDNVELDAAVFAASLFASKSKCFASSICGKLAEMIESPSVPLDMKLKLVSIFEHMRFDPENYQRVRQLCTQMLVNYPSSKFVLPVLRTLTHLAACSLVDIPGQITLLLKYFSGDVRRIVRIAVLKDLCQLARRAPHVWTDTEIVCLCDAMKPHLSADLLLGVVSVLTVLSQTVVLAHLPPDAGTHLLDSCLACCYHENVSVVATATQMLIGIVAEKQKDDGRFLSSSLPLIENAGSVLEMALTIAISNGTLQECQKVILSIVRLCQLHAPAIDRFVDAIASCLGQVVSDLGQVGSQLGHQVATTSGSTVNDNMPVRKVVSLCDGLSAIGDLHSDDNVLVSIIPDLVQVLDIALQGRPGRTEDGLPQLGRDTSSEVLVALNRLILQACAEDELRSNVIDVLTRVQHEADDWMLYKIGRQAARYGHHGLAAAIFGRLTVAVSSEQYYFWLNALKECCWVKVGSSGSPH